MTANQTSRREIVRMSSRPQPGGRFTYRNYGRPMAYGSGTRRPRRRRKIGRKLLALLVLGVVLWYGRREIASTVQGWVGGAKPRVETVGRGEPGARGAGSDRPQSAPGQPVSTPAARAEDGDGGVTRAGLFDRMVDWLEHQTAGLFEVRRIDLSGERSLSSAELLAGLDSLRGAPLLSVDPPSIADSLRLQPRIKDVVIERQLPSTLRVQVEERRDVAVLVSNGGVWGIDEARVVLPLPGRAWPLDLPVISGLTYDPQPGSTLADAGVGAALDWVKGCAASPRVNQWLAEVHVSNGRIAWIAGEDGRMVLPGKHSVIAQVATLDAFLASPGVADSNRVVDLSFPDYLILRQKAWTGPKKSDSQG